MGKPLKEKLTCHILNTKFLVWAPEFEGREGGYHSQGGGAEFSKSKLSRQKPFTPVAPFFAFLCVCLLHNTFGERTPLRGPAVPTLAGAQPVVLHHLERPVLGLGGQEAVGRLQGPGCLAAVARVPPREVQVAARGQGWSGSE